MEDGHKKELIKVLRLGGGVSLSTSKRDVSWAEIYVEIGKLQERADRPSNVYNQTLFDGESTGAPLKPPIPPFTTC